MKADWDKLGDKYANSESVMIVDADCTGPAQQTCQKHGVKGYPTIQYFKAGSKKGTPYQGGRDYSSLAKFAAGTLDKGPPCDPLTLKGCKPIEKKFIEANQDKSVEELQAEIDERTATAKERKAAKKAADKEYRAMVKEHKMAEKKHKMASTILKKLIKKAKKSSRDEL